MRKIMGWILFAVAAWMLVSPQALLGLKALKWMADYAFPGEVLIGIVVISVAFYLIDVKIDLENSGHSGH